MLGNLARHTANVQIRDAKPDDLPAIAPIFREIVADGETYAYPEDLTDAHIAAAWMEPPPARCIHHRGSPEAATALAEEVLRWAIDQGYAAMQFNAVVETNMGAVALWQQLGFRILTTVPGTFRSRHHGPVGLHVMFRELG